MNTANDLTTSSQGRLYLKSKCNYSLVKVNQSMGNQPKTNVIMIYNVIDEEKYTQHTPNFS